MTEFGLISKISAAFPDLPEGCEGIGDDCAILPQRDGMQTLVSTDMLVEGTHFLLRDIAARDLGWKSAAVNISDIAAMGGYPKASFLSLALPPSVSESWAEEFIAGYRDISLHYGCPLMGGDTTRSPERLCINVAVLGEAPRGSARKRSDARSGDLVCVSGPLGDSAAGLDVILSGCSRGELEQQLVNRHYHPIPRVETGLMLASWSEVHAMMDISDGIGSDLRHILDASKLSARIDCARLPLSDHMLAYCSRRGLDPLKFALSGGEDYELLFTASPSARARIEQEGLHVIGELLPSDSCGQILWEGGSMPDYKGFTHF